MYYVLIKHFNTFMHDHAVCRVKEHFCYFLQAFSTAEILKSHANDYFKINGKVMIPILLCKNQANSVLKKKEPYQTPNINEL